MSGNLRALLDSARNAKDDTESDEVTPPPIRKPTVKAASKAVATPAKPAPKATVGKYRDPDYEPVKLYLRSKLRKAAARKWEDSNGGDFSNLIDSLLTKYLSS